MNRLRNINSIRQFYHLGRHDSQTGTNAQDSECLTQNTEAFKKELKTISGSHTSDTPDDQASAEDCYLHTLNAVKSRRLEIRQIFHQYGQCIFRKSETIMIHFLILTLITTEAAMIRPAMRNLFPGFGFVESMGYMSALIIGLAVIIHIAGSSLRSKRYVLATSALALIIATNALLIVARSLVVETTALFTSVLTCVALIVTKSSIYLTYRIAFDESNTDLPSVDFYVVAEEYRNEGRKTRMIEQLYRYFNDCNRAYFRGYYSQKIDEMTAFQPRKSSWGIKTATALTVACLPVSASDLAARIEANPSTLHLGNGPVGVELSVIAKDPDRFRNALIGVQLQVTGNGLAEKFRLKNATDLDSWSWTPVSPGNYRIRLSAITPGGYPIEANSEFNVLSPESDLGFSSPVIVPFAPNKKFEITVPVPEIPYPNLDICFGIDISMSMDDEIEAFKRSAAAIFDSLKDVSSDPLASVLTFSHAAANSAGLLEPINYGLTIPPTDNEALIAGMNLGTGGGNESTYYALQFASQLDIFRSDALRFLVLMTDEADNVYHDKADRHESWHPDGLLSPNSILERLRAKNFCVGVVYSELTEAQSRSYYSDIMEHSLQDRFAGAYPLSLSGGNTTQRIVTQVRGALERLVGQTQLLLRLASSEDSEWISEIQPVSPRNCIAGTGFNLGRLRQNNVSEMRFRITLSASAPKSPQRFFIEGSTDKGTVNHIVPIVLSN